jgi:hypothetical protein
MPYLHWGTLKMLEWRNGLIDRIKNSPITNKQNQKGLNVEDEFKMMLHMTYPDLTSVQFEYALLMFRHLGKAKDMHPRRTLDQYYYTHLPNTDLRDRTQVVSRYGPGGKHWSCNHEDGGNEDNHTDRPSIGSSSSQSSECLKQRDIENPNREKQPGSGDETILMVDKLWLWVLGGSTIHTLPWRVTALTNNFRRNYRYLLRPAM